MQASGDAADQLLRETIELLVMQQRSVLSAAFSLGVNCTSLHQRRDARYGPETIERYGPTSELLAGLVEKLGIDAVVAELGTLPLNVRRWQKNADSRPGEKDRRSDGRAARHPRRRMKRGPGSIDTEPREVGRSQPRDKAGRGWQPASSPPAEASLARRVRVFLADDDSIGMKKGGR